ncbi:ABC transporter permease subunit [Glycomyces buryatensis]|uniref:ABC transporter permease n=1 Tax=Glycomyces buryatensis TaxID=2570927 RepID=A0A4S8PX25_9ACTN|nr:ABC transporter permease subunit [Glycomyces buryatensis]THV34615.1 hypothetical protein FAB82_24020 [Glycomyces buryatensis]
MNLYQSEIHRTRRRVLTLIFAIMAGVGLLALTVIMWFNSSTGPTEAQLADAQEIADEMNGEYEECASDENFFEDSPDWSWALEDEYYEDYSHEEMCAEFFTTGSEWVAEDFIYTYTFHLDREGVYIIMGAVLVVGLLAMLLSASAIGAEWTSGGMANLLVWHPNRLRVWGAKLGAALTITAASLVATAIVAFGLLYLTASVRGEVGNLNAVWWEDSLEIISRTVALGLGMSVLGASLAMLGRHTAIAGGIIAGYLIIGDLLVRFASIALRIEFPERLSLYTWVEAWLLGRKELFQWTAAGREETMVITSTDAGILIGLVIAGFAVLATWAFAKRDVT